MLFKWVTWTLFKIMNVVHYTLFEFMVIICC